MMIYLTREEVECLRDFFCRRTICEECRQPNGEMVCDMCRAYYKKSDGYNMAAINSDFFKVVDRKYIRRQAKKNPTYWQTVKKFFMTGATLV